MQSCKTASFRSMHTPGEYQRAWTRPSLVAVAALVLFLPNARSQQVKTVTYEKQHTPCLKTFQMTPGRILTSHGLVEDPHVNQIMKQAVSAQMSARNITEATANPDFEVRFLGGAGAGLQTDYGSLGDYAVWDIGGPSAVTGRTYKKSVLGIAVVDPKSNKTLWAAKCMDKFGDPNHLEERINGAVAKAFSKFPKSLLCQ